MPSHDGGAGISFREILAAWIVCSALYLLIILGPLATSPPGQLDSQRQQEAMTLDLTEMQE